MTPKDLESAIGRMNRVYEVLNHTRPLTLKMIRNLHGQFGIPAESLIKAPTRHRNTSTIHAPNNAYRVVWPEQSQAGRSQRSDSTSEHG